MRAIVAILAVVCLTAAPLLAGGNSAPVRTRTSLTTMSPTTATLGVKHAEFDAVTIPQMLSYQGKLTDTLGQPVADTFYAIRFMLYAQPTGGSPFWQEDQQVGTWKGLFSVLLGSVAPIGSMPAGGEVYLAMSVSGGRELAPRLRVVSAAYAYKADTANYALAAAGGDNAWARVGADSVLYTIHNLGIARGGADNVLYGNGAFSHVNFGWVCTTGTSGQDYYSATVGGGAGNVASGDRSTVGGGRRNVASGDRSTVAGGDVDSASGYCAAVGGGDHNRASGDWAAVGGGSYNRAGGVAAMVPGGHANYAVGNCSFAAGRYARASHPGSFVWSDSVGSSADSLNTTGSNQFRVRARGGAWFFSNLAKTTGAYLAPGSNSWESACDSATKEDFRPVDSKALLDRVAGLRVRNYKMKDQDDGTRHIGPVAQDFHNAFGVGETETGINMADADGVLLAAVQALYEEVKVDKARIAQLEAELARSSK